MVNNKTHCSSIQLRHFPLHVSRQNSLKLDPMLNYFLAENKISYSDYLIINPA